MVYSGRYYAGNYPQVENFVWLEFGVYLLEAFKSFCLT